MSIAVAVISGGGAALATDSLHVQLTAPPTWSTGYVKHVRVGARAAGIVGVADFQGHLVATWVATALSAARTVREVPFELLHAGGTTLVQAYRHWRSVVGPAPGPEEFLTVLVIEAGRDGATALVTRAAVVDDKLTLVSDIDTTVSETSVVVIGAADSALLAHTDDGQTLQLAERLQGAALSDPPVSRPQPDLAGAACEDLAQRLVAEAIDRQVHLPRPSWWPADVPVVTGPVNSVQV